MSDAAKAMQMVIDDMGRAAKAAKAKRYAPKPEPVAEQPETPAEGTELGEADLSALAAALNGG